MNEQRFLEFMAETKTNVDEYGVSVMGVIGSHAYTIGMANLGLPDLIMTGNLHQETCQMILNDLVCQWKEKGVQYGDNLNLISDRSGQPLRAHVRAIAPDQTFYDDYVRQAINFYLEYPDYMKTEIPMFAQIMWPDTNGKLPTEESYLHHDCHQPLFKVHQ